jgi:hypothetical protein
MKTIRYILEVLQSLSASEIPRSHALERIHLLGINKQ